VREQLMNSTGPLLFLMVLLSVASTVFPSVSPLWPALFSWLAAIILVRQLPRAMIIQVSIMMLIGIACLLKYADTLSTAQVIQSLSANHKLIAIIAAVGFLRLITQTESAEEALPVGKIALIKTLWGVHLFSSVITLTAMMLVGNRIKQDASLNRLHAIMFSRTFAAGCFWSPFYVAIATALVYAPGSNLWVLSLAGMPIAIFGLCLTSWQFYRDPEAVESVGFPIHLDALTIPLTLSVLVITIHLMLPDFSVLTLITMLVLALTVILLYYQQRSRATQALAQHIRIELPKIVRELSLFLGAGVMSTGISVLIVNSDLSLSLSEFTAETGIIFIIASILVSIVGVHPIITISVIGSLMSGSNFEPDFLGICMMMMWGLGIVISPLSGVNLAIQGRFGFSSFSFLRWNALYVLGMLVFCSLLLSLYQHLLSP
jgi:hypothetical protein